MSHKKFMTCIDACLDCSTQCHHCASECLKEPEIHLLVKCIQLERECAEICLSTARMLMMGSDHAKAVCLVCIDFCDRCAAECKKHSHMEHCKKCAEACEKCSEECKKTVSMFY